MMRRRDDTAPGALDGRRGTGTAPTPRNLYSVAPDEVAEMATKEKPCIPPSESPVDASGPVLHLVARGKPTRCPLA